MANYKVLMII